MLFYYFISIKYTLSHLLESPYRRDSNGILCSCATMYTFMDSKDKISNTYQVLLFYLHVLLADLYFCAFALNANITKIK